MAGVAGDDFSGGDAFVLGLVRQHRPGDHVADGIDACHVGLVMPIGDDATAVVLRDAGLLEAKTFRERHPPIAISATSASTVSAAPPAAGSICAFSRAPDLSMR